jgi:hypothetical protein
MIGGETISVGLDQNPETGMGFDQLGATGIELRLTGEVPTGEADDVADRSESLGAEGDCGGLQNSGAKGRPLSVEDAGAATAAGIVGMKSGGLAPRLIQIDLLIVFEALLEYFLGSVPLSFSLFAEIPGMALAAGEVAARLIYGKVIFRTGEMGGRDESLEMVILFPQSGLTSRGLLTRR